MTTYNTGNPIGSTDSRDRLDNTENMDYLENSTTELTHADRLGTVRKTRHGMEVEHDNQIAAHESEHDAQMQSFENSFDARLAGMAFTRVGTFTAGATLTDARQTLLWEVSEGGDGHYYSWSGSFGTSGKAVAAGSSPSPIAAGSWVDRTDVMLRDEILAMEHRFLGAGAVLYKGSNGDYVQNGDVVPSDATHLTILINGLAEYVAMSPVASGVISSLTESSATIGGVSVYLSSKDAASNGVYITETGGDKKGVSDNSDALLKASKINGTVRFAKGTYMFNQRVFFENSVKIITDDEVDIVWSGSALDTNGAEGMWDTNNADVEISVIGNFKFSHTLGGMSFNGPYIRMLNSGGVFDGIEMVNSKFTIVRNSSKISNGQGGKGAVNIFNSKFLDVENGPTTYGFYPWWDDKLNTTELNMVNCHVRSLERLYIAEYVGKVHLDNNTFETMGGVVYQNNANDWDNDTRWVASSGITTRLDNILRTEGGIGGSLSIDLIDLGFSIGDFGYIVLECNLLGYPSGTRPASSMNVNGTNFKTEIYDNKMARFEVTDNGSGGATLAIVFGSGGEIRMRDLVIFKGNSNRSYIAHGNYYSIANNRYLGCEWGPTVGIDGRRIQVHDNLVVGAKRPVNIDTVSYPNSGGKSLEYAYPDAFGVVSGNIFIACYDHMYITGCNLQVKDNLFQSVGHLSSRAVININSRDRQFPGSWTDDIADDFSWSTDIYIADNNFINAQTRLGYISGFGRMVIGDGNIHDSAFDTGTNGTLWTAERNDENLNVKSMVTYQSKGYKGTKTINTSGKIVDIYEDVTIIDNPTGATMDIKLPTDSYNRCNGVLTTLVYPNNAPGLQSSVRFQVTSGYGTLNGGGPYLTWPQGAWKATILSISDNNDYIITFEYGHPQDKYLTGTGTPLNIITPQYRGQEYLDTATNAWYKAANTSSSSWTKLSN